MNKEITVAVDWWAQRLCDSAPKVDSGDAGIDTFATIINSLRAERKRHITPEQVALFTTTLTRILTELYTDSWRPNSAVWGSSTRALTVDYAPCEVLSAAAQLAGINAKCNFPRRRSRER